ncbi:MAG: hypothetical protein QF745_02665, partial [Planctomycetota bacterium]|nr:hypothetical protein [Planctomycetota bacterium]
RRTFDYAAALRLSFSLETYSVPCLGVSRSPLKDMRLRGSKLLGVFRNTLCPGGLGCLEAL